MITKHFLRVSGSFRTTPADWRKLLFQKLIEGNDVCSRQKTCPVLRDHVWRLL